MITFTRLLVATSLVFVLGVVLGVGALSVMQWIPGRLGEIVALLGVVGAAMGGSWVVVQVCFDA